MTWKQRFRHSLYWAERARFNARLSPESVESTQLCASRIATGQAVNTSGTSGARVSLALTCTQDMCAYARERERERERLYAYVRERGKRGGGRKREEGR